MGLKIGTLLKVVRQMTLVSGVCVFLCGGIAVAADATDLQQQIDALQKKVDTLEKNYGDTPDQTAAKKAATKGYFAIPGTDTEIKIGGYAKLDLVYSDKSAGDGSPYDQFYGPTAVPLDNNATVEKNQTVLHARQSRLNIATASDTSYGKLTTFFEGDFFGSGGNQTVSNSYGLRLRHFYGQLGKVLAGQTWTTFQVLEAIPETLDFGGPAAAIFCRQAQIRWTEPVSWGSLQFALENAETTYGGNDGPTNPTTYKTISADDNTFPDVIARANFKTQKGTYSLGVMARNLRYDDGVTDDDEWGGAVMAGGRIPALGKDDIRFQLMYGNALGRYMNTGFAGATMNASGKLDGLDQFGGFIAYRHVWTDGLRSNVMYSFGQADNNNDILEDTNKTIQSAHINLIWSPVPKVDVGVEYMYGAREQEDGEDGDLNRIQMSAQYNFF